MTAADHHAAARTAIEDDDLPLHVALDLFAGHMAAAALASGEEKGSAQWTTIAARWASLARKCGDTRWATEQLDLYDLNYAQFAADRKALLEL